MIQGNCIDVALSQRRELVGLGSPLRVLDMGVSYAVAKRPDALDWIVPVDLVMARVVVDVERQGLQRPHQSLEASHRADELRRNRLEAHGYA